MPNLNQGVLDGVRRIGAAFRELKINGGSPGVPLGYRLRGATQSGPPAAGTWRRGDQVPDRAGTIWTCISAGTPGGWAAAGTPALAPSGDQTGNTDTAVIQAALASTAPVRLVPGTFYLTQLTLPPGGRLIGAGRLGSSQEPAGAGHFTQFQAGTAASQASMILVPAGNGAWQLEDIYFEGQAPGGAKPYTTAVIQVQDYASTPQLADFGVISGCDVNNSAGDGIYIGTRRGGVRVDNCVTHNHAGTALNVQGGDCIITRTTMSFSGHGYIAAGEMTRIGDCDIFQNTVGGSIQQSRVYLRGCSHDQNQQQGLIVGSGATGVSVHGRFMLSSMSSTGTYPHIDLSGSASGGVTITPGTMFAEQEFGDTQRVSYDILSAGTAHQDYSTWAAAGFSVAHADSLSVTQQAGVIAAIIQRMTDV